MKQYLWSRSWIDVDETIRCKLEAGRMKETFAV